MKFEYDFDVAKVTIELNDAHPLVISTRKNFPNPILPGSLHDWLEMTAIGTAADECKQRFDLLHKRLFPDEYK